MTGALEQLTATLRENAGIAERANQLALSASSVFVQDGSVVNRVVTIDRINASSRTIVDIIGVIDATACQTNILASSAAVEAARHVALLEHAVRRGHCTPVAIERSVGADSDRNALSKYKFPVGIIYIQKHLKW